MDETSIVGLAVLLRTNCSRVDIAESGCKNQEIKKEQFYQDLCDSIIARLQPDKEPEISNAVEILNAANWPTELSPEFNEQEVKFLYDKFGLSFSNLKIDFRDYKHGGGGEQRAVKINLRQFFNCIATVPISTAACKRGFSMMNIICISLRSQLSPEYLTASMFRPYLL